LSSNRRLLRFHYSCSRSSCQCIFTLNITYLSWFFTRLCINMYKNALYLASQVGQILALFYQIHTYVFIRLNSCQNSLVCDLKYLDSFHLP
jgi:uncharacterized protein YebE (UPF0316 family)